MRICQRLFVLLQSGIIALPVHAEMVNPSTVELEEVVVIGASLYDDQINALKRLRQSSMSLKVSSSLIVLRLRAGAMAAFQTSSTIFLA